MNFVQVQEYLSDDIVAMDCDNVSSDTMLTSLSDMVVKSNWKGCFLKNESSNFVNKMSENEKCDIAKLNPLYGSELPYKCSVGQTLLLF